MSTATALQPYVRLSQLDILILRLAAEGNGVCRSRDTGNRVYSALVDAICTPNRVNLVKGITITKPLYPYILVSYYLLFRRKDLVTAVQLTRKLLEASRFSKTAPDNNEEMAVHTLAKVAEELYALRKQSMNEYRGVLGKILALLISKLEQSPLGNPCDRYYRDEWGCVFKELVEANIDPNPVKSLERLRRVKETVRMRLRSYEELDEEIVEGYNLFTGVALLPIYAFLESEVERLENKLREVERLVEERRRIERKYNMVVERGKGLRMHVSDVRSLGSAAVLLSARLLALPALRYYERELRKVDEKVRKVAELKVKEVAITIWFS